jgi:hypothetical protein
MNRLVLLACCLVASSAAAETLEPLVKHEAGFGIAVNNPLMWRDQESIGVSLYYRFAPKQVIRINFAHYELAGSPVEHAVGFARDGYLEPPDDRYTGRRTDIGVGWTYYPWRAFDGPSMEVGALWRDNDEFHSSGRLTHDELLRALVGWSYLFHEHMFAAVAAGGSVGTANGTQYGMQPGVMDEKVSTWTAGFEGYVRLGFVFGN